MRSLSERLLSVSHKVKPAEQRVFIYVLVCNCFKQKFDPLLQVISKGSVKLIKNMSMTDAHRRNHSLGITLMMYYSGASYREMSHNVTTLKLIIYVLRQCQKPLDKNQSPAVNVSVIFPIFGREAVEIKAEGR